MQDPCPRCGSAEQVSTAQELFAMLNGGRANVMARLEQLRQYGPGYQPGQGNQPYGDQQYEQVSDPYGPGTQQYGPASGGQTAEPPSGLPSYGPPPGDAPNQPPAYGPPPGDEANQPPPNQPPPDTNPYGPPPGGQSQGPGELRSEPGYTRSDQTFGSAQPDWMSQASPSTDPGQQIADAVMGAAGRFLGRRMGKRAQRAFEERVMPTVEGKMQRARGQFEQSQQEQTAIVERYPDLRGCMQDQVVFLAGGSQSVPVSEIRMPITLAQADELVQRLRA
jgi:hypothetical protein